jgi:hypothetical protein
MAIIDKPTDYFNTVLWSGNATNRDITGVGFQPDFTWIKNRSAGYSHVLGNSLSGDNKFLSSNSTSAESTDSDKFRTFVSDGIQVGTHNGVNASGSNYVGWNWKAGTAFTNDASATGIGSIDSTGSVNDTAGFSIVSYTGTGSAGTIKHGLSSKPSMIIFKNLSAGRSWMVYHQSLGATKFLYLDATDAEGTDSGFFNDTEPTSSVFSVGTANNTNYNGEAIIAYCFAEKQGYSKFGSYVGNGNADGTFVYTGFKVAMIICKNTGAAEDWIIKDNTRDIDNPVDDVLYPNGDYAEDDGATVDFLSNGFKCRTTAANTNQSGNTFIYMAFAENPFVSSTGVPATAR